MAEHFVYLGELVQLADKFYPKKKFIHAARVATYALQDAATRKNVHTEDAYAVGLAHDLIEDTDCTPQDLEFIMSGDLINAVMILSKGDNEPYEDYIERLVALNDPLIMLVKKADMKDHLMQAETLTDKLWEKYKPHLKYFL